MGSARRPLELKEIKNNDEDRKERIYQRWEKIRDFDLDVQKTAAKISRMCTDKVQKEFLSVKPQPNRTQKNSGTGSRDVTVSNILHQSIAHLTSFTEFDTMSVRMLANI